MRRSHTKSRLYFFGIFLLVIFSILIACNLVLHSQKDRISQAAAKYFTQKVSLDNLLYLPPDYVFLKNVTLSENSTPGSENILSIPLVMIRFSLVKSLAQGKLLITDICVYDSNARYSKFRDFVKYNFKQIWQFFLDLPRQDIRFMVKDAKFHLARENGGPGYVNSRFFLKIKDNSFFGYGSFNRDLLGHFPGIPLDFIFKGNLEKDGATVDNLEIIRENVYAKLWGSVHDYLLKFNGFSFLNTTFKEHAYYEPFLTLRERFENFLRGFPAEPKSLEMPKVDMFLLDLDGRIDFHLPKIDIQRLRFSLNNSPMSLTGKVNFTLDQPLELDLLYSTSFSQLKNWTAESPTLKKIDIALKGSLKDSVFKGNSNIKFDFLKKNSESNLPLEDFTASLQGLDFSFKQFPSLTASVKGLDIFCRTDTRDYEVGLQYLGLAMDLKNPLVKFAEFESRFYDGGLKGRVWLDMSSAPPHITSFLRIENASANKLQGIVEHFSKVHGQISGQMRFRNFPELNLKGGLVVNQGYIENFEFLKWLAGFFDLPSVRKIEFPQAVLNFSADPEGVGLSNIRLDSSDIDIGGGFHLGTNDMVNSKLSLTCSRHLLQSSVKFRPLLRLVSKQTDELTFEFRLSGNLHKMNFLWLESDFKRKLRDAIPGFMERSVERKIEESLQPLAQ